MKKFLIKIFLILVLLISTGLSAYAADREEAIKAATEILSAIQNKNYETLWNNLTSKYFQSLTTKNAFIANLAISRQQFTTGKYEFTDISYSKKDEQSGIAGEIYACTFLTTYNVGKFYEKIVVIKEEDGRFRLSGIWGAPAQ